MNLFELTKQLMSIPSVTGAEGELAEFLAAHLAAGGYRVERQHVAPGRFNVFAYAGAAEAPVDDHLLVHRGVRRPWRRR